MRRLAAILAVISLLTLGAGSALAATGIELFAPLTGSKAYPGAHGSSTYDRAGKHRDVHVTVKGIKSLAGKRVTVYVAGQVVGKILVSKGGAATRTWDTEHGQKVPFASAGSKVKVKTASGTLVASGTNHKHHR